MKICEGKTLHLARTFMPAGTHVPAGTQCEGQDLNPWTSTGAELESAAVSRLGYPRTHLLLDVAGAKTLRTTAQVLGGRSPESGYGRPHP
jgi:hypothetical protein